MDKRFGFHPTIILSSSGGDGSVIGHGSGQGGVVLEATPCSYEHWLTSEWKQDLVGEQGDLTPDGTIDAYDFGAWWAANEFGEEDWNQLNPGLDYETYVF